MMKKFNSAVRTGGVKTVTDENGNYLYQLWKTEEVNGKSVDFEDFVSQNKPLKPSEKLINAIKKAFNENGSVRYNCGHGNQTFYFSDDNS